MEERNKKIEEFRKKIEARRKRKLKIFFFIIIIGFLIYGFYFIKNRTLKFLWNLETFKIKEIEIYPENIAPLIKAVLELEKDKNLLFLDAESLRERINSISEVEYCKILKKYPSTLHIDITLRNPWAILKNEDGEYIIDKKGFIIKSNTENTSLLVVYGVKVNKNENRVEEIEKINILNEIEKWYNYFNLGNFLKINKVDISNPNKIEISDGERSIYFTGEKIKEKIENLSIVLKNLKNDFEYIDTRFKNFYIKLKNEGKNNNSN